MEYSILMILIALLQYIFFTGRVGFSRVKYKVDAPKTIGDETWERLFRVQQNTLEQLVVFIPGMIIFNMYVSPTWVLLPGILFVLGRQIYAHTYIKNPQSRALGMVLSFFSNFALVLGGLIGLCIKIAA